MSSTQFLQIQGHTSFSHKLVLCCLAKKSVVSTTFGVRTENWLRIEQVRIRTKIHFRPIFRDVGTMSKRFLLQHLGRFWWKRPLFLFINCVLNLVDMVTDSIACSYLFEKNQPHWALLSLLWMLAPFFVHLIIFLTNRNRYSENLTSAFYHLPFVTPFHNLYLFWKLYRMEYPYHDPKHSKDIELILHDVGLISFYESFCEAGPQSVTTCVIFLCTGRISKIQIFSLFASLASLTWGASRAFFILRNEYDADPDPMFSLVILRIFPLMLVSVINSLLMWVLIWGFLGPYTFVCLVMNFSLVLLILSRSPYCGKLIILCLNSIFILIFGTAFLIEHNLYGSNHIVMLFVLYISITLFVLQKYQLKRDENERFSVIASLCSLWVPCVIGNEKYSFSETVYLTLSFKLSEVAIAFSMAFAGYQWRTVFLLWCLSEESLPSDSSDLALCSFSPDSSMPPCFTMDNSDLHQQFRVCGANEQSLRLYIFLAVTISNLLAFLASRHLDKYSSYEYLYHATKTLIWIIPTTPVIHRSLLFSLVDSENIGALETVLGRENDRSLAEYVNRPNHQGETPLHNACKKQSSRSAQILLRAGAIPTRNSRQETPLHIACRSGSPQCLQLLLDQMLKVEDLAEACNIPLHLASVSSSLDCARILINKGANLEATNRNFDTPLHFACRASTNQFLRFLLDSGADFTAKNGENETPLEIACSRAETHKVPKGSRTDRSIILEFCKFFACLTNKDEDHSYTVEHVEDKLLPQYLRKWHSKGKGNEETAQLGKLLGQGFKFSFENLPSEEMDAMKQAIEQWNSVQNTKCKWI